MTSISFLDFEKSIEELEKKIEDLKKIATSDSFDITNEIQALQKKVQKLLVKTYSNLTPWQKVQVARHPQRPQFLDYVNELFENFVELRGDRNFADDRSILGGLAKFQNKSVMLIGQQRGNTAETRVYHNYGMSKPEGYRKAIRLMELADKFGLPIVTFIDTQGAYPGIDAEARGQGQAIASSIACCLKVRVPILAIIIGEGYSGGAIAICTADRLLMLEHSVYSVISPEGCASILWKSIEKKQEAAIALKITSEDLKKLNIVDEVIEEPIGGAQRDTAAIFESVKKALSKHFSNLINIKSDAILNMRLQKYLG